MRILLTGRQGQLGWELQRVLAPVAHVIALGREDLDLSQPDRIRQQVEATRPDLIINAAAYTAVDRSESDEAAAMAINAQAPAAFAESAARLGVPLIHYSTDYVFDGTKSGAYAETDIPNPLGVYGRSKLAGEHAIQACGCPYLIFRISWIYDVRGKNFLLTMLRLAREKPELRVVRDQIGAPTWSRMVAEATGSIVSATRGDLAQHTGLYHLAAAGSTSWHGFATRIVALGAERGLCAPVPVLPIATSEYPTPTRRPLNSLLDSRKVKATFGIALPDWSEGLRSCMDDLRARTPG
jgi:dTDP-4-dehydrorhamnose reductase